MRVSREQAGQNRLAVLKAAGKLFRDRGFDGVGIADIMQAAGLTHGGFYGQFRSKEHLMAEACDSVFGVTAGKWERVAACAEGDPVEALADFYLSAEHVRHRANGCPIAALASDAVRSSDDVRDVFTAGISRHLDVMDAAFAARSGGAPDDQAEALAALSTLVGALVLSRAVNDPALSDAFLESAARKIRRKPDS